MTSRIIASVDIDDEVTLQLQLDIDDALFVSCGRWSVPIERVHSSGAPWVEENLAPENLLPALSTLDFFADYAKAFTDRVK